MIMETSNCKTVGQSQPRNVATAEEAHPRGVLLEACDFERMLQRAVEVLKVRERAA